MTAFLMALCRVPLLFRSVERLRCAAALSVVLLLFFFAPSVSLGEVNEAPKAKGVKVAPRTVPLVITSESLEADNKRGQVTFRGNVIAEEEFLLCSDELFLGYGDESKVDSIVATGDVRIVHGTKVSGADRAEYERAGRILVLTGNAVILECGDIVKGERIEVYLDEDRAVIDGGAGSGGGAEGSGRVRAVIMPQKSCVDGGGPEAGSTAGKTEVERGADGESRCEWARQVLR